MAVTLPPRRWVRTPAGVARDGLGGGAGVFVYQGMQAFWRFPWCTTHGEMQFSVGSGEVVPVFRGQVQISCIPW